MLLGLKAALNVVGTAFGIKDEIDKKKPDLSLMASNGSITNFLGELIVEPTFILSPDIKDSSAYNDILGFQINMFATLYSTALVKLVELNGHNVSVALSILSSKGGASGTPSAWATRIGLENDLSDTELSALADTVYGKSLPTVKTEARKDNKDDKTSELLSKNINVELQDSEGKRVNIPIIIRAEIIVAGREELIDYVKLYSDGSSLSSRRRKLKSKLISKSEFIFCKDLLKDYGKSIKRKNGSKVNISERLEERKRRALLNNSASPVGLGRDYGSMIVSTEYKHLINTAIKGNIDDDGTRDKLLNRTASFNILVVNNSHMAVQLYMSNVRGTAGTLPFDKLKTKDENDKLSSLFDAITNTKKVRL